MALGYGFRGRQRRIAVAPEQVVEQGDVAQPQRQRPGPVAGGDRQHVDGQPEVVAQDRLQRPDVLVEDRGVERQQGGDQGQRRAGEGVRLAPEHPPERLRDAPAIERVGDGHEAGGDGQDGAGDVPRGRHQQAKSHGPGDQVVGGGHRRAGIDARQQADGRVPLALAVGDLGEPVEDPVHQVRPGQEQRPTGGDLHPGADQGPFPPAVRGRHFPGHGRGGQAPGILDAGPDQRQDGEPEPQSGHHQGHEDHGLEHVGHRGPPGDAGAQAESVEDEQLGPDQRGQPGPEHRLANHAEGQRQQHHGQEAGDPRPEEGLEAVVVDLHVGGPDGRIGRLGEHVPVGLLDRELLAERLDLFAQLAHRRGKAGRGGGEPLGAIGRVALDVNGRHLGERLLDVFHGFRRIMAQRRVGAQQQGPEAQPGLRVLVRRAVLLQRVGVQRRHHAQGPAVVEHGQVQVGRLPGKIIGARGQGIHPGQQLLVPLGLQLRRGGDALLVLSSEPEGQFAGRKAEPRGQRLDLLEGKLAGVGHLEQPAQRRLDLLDRLAGAGLGVRVAELVEALLERLPGLHHLGELVEEPGVGVGQRRRDERDLAPAVVGLRQLGRFLVHALELELPALGLRLPHLLVDLFAPFPEPVGILALVGRDVAQPAAPRVQKRHAQDLLAQRVVLGDQKRHPLPGVRLDQPAQEQLRGGELPRPLVGEQLARRRVLGRGDVLARQRGPQREPRGLASADIRGGVARERVQRHHAAVGKDRHVLPGVEVQGGRVAGQSCGGPQEPEGGRQQETSDRRPGHQPFSRRACPPCSRAAKSWDPAAGKPAG